MYQIINKFPFGICVIIILIFCAVKFIGVIPDALKTDCRKCTDVQKSQIEKFMKFLIKNRSADSGCLDDKYSPLGEYKKNLAKFSA